MEDHTLYGNHVRRRGKFGARRYLGIELEVSQALAFGPARRQTDVPNRIAHSLALLLTGQAE